MQSARPSIRYSFEVGRVRVLVPVPVQGLVPVPALVRVHGTASIHQGQKLCLVSKVRRALVPRCMLRRRSKINNQTWGLVVNMLIRQAWRRSC